MSAGHTISSQPNAMTVAPCVTLGSGEVLRLIELLPHASGGNRAVVCEDAHGGRFYLTEEEWRRASSAAVSAPGVTAASSAREKLALFRLLFHCRDDVFDHGYRRKDGGIGYTPACANEFAPGACPRCEGKRVPCTACENRSFLPLTDHVFVAHFKGTSTRFRDVVGGFTLLPGDATKLVAADFDGKDWQQAVTAYREAARRQGIEVAVERSRSGAGAHAWIFFEELLPARTARALASGLLAEAMRSSRSIGFTSFDRLFPSQDSLPEGGFGNVIALPFQGRAQRMGNSVFVDDDFIPYQDQWAYLSSIDLVSVEEAERVIARLGAGGAEDGAEDVACEVCPTRGASRATARSAHARRVMLKPGDIADGIAIEEADMLYVPDAALTPAGAYAVKHLATYANPAFYRAQAAHRSVYRIPRFIDLGEERGGAIALPRGCKEGLCSLLEQAGVRYTWEDGRWEGRRLAISFKGELRDEQQSAADELLRHEQGILAAPTGYGKTVIAAYLIGALKVPTLIIVPRTVLVENWIEKLAAFLSIEERPEPVLTKSGRPSKRQRPQVGRVGGGSTRLSGIVDVAMFPSLMERGEDGSRRAKELVEHYGLVICDECHHAAAPQYEVVLKACPARYVYGLSATPKRDDGLTRSLTMLCGPVRYRIHPREQARQQGIRRVLVPRFTGMRYPAYEERMSYQQVLDLLCAHEARNRLIVEDTLAELGRGRTCLVVSKRKEHARSLCRALEDRGASAYLLVGEGTPRERRERIEGVSLKAGHGALVLVATESYLGEGFDLPQLEVLLLATPVSFEGNLIQQVGRLHRTFEGKDAVYVYDYVDTPIPKLGRSYKRRLKTYASLAYEVSTGSSLQEGSASQAGGADGAPSDTGAAIRGEGAFVDHRAFAHRFERDIAGAKRTVRIWAPYASERYVATLLPQLRSATDRGISVVCTICREDPDHEHPDGRATERAALQHERYRRVRDSLKQAGVEVVFDADAPAGLALFDQELVWYGDLPLLGFAKRDGCRIRFRSAEVAHELQREGLDALAQSFRNKRCR